MQLSPLRTGAWSKLAPTTRRRTARWLGSARIIGPLSIRSLAGAATVQLMRKISCKGSLRVTGVFEIAEWPEHMGGGWHRSAECRSCRSHDRAKRLTPVFSRAYSGPATLFNPIHQMNTRTSLRHFRRRMNRTNTFAKGAGLRSRWSRTTRKLYAATHGRDAWQLTLP